MACARFFSAMVFAGLSFGQRLIEFNAKLGVPVSDSSQIGSFQFLATGLQESSSATRRYTHGAGAVLRLPRSFGAEVDVLYKRLEYDLTSSNPSIAIVHEHTWTTANSWGSR
jgi:hypothetical protein